MVNPFSSSREDCGEFFIREISRLIVEEWQISQRILCFVRVVIYFRGANPPLPSVFLPDSGIRSELPNHVRGIPEQGCLPSPVRPF